MHIHMWDASWGGALFVWALSIMIYKDRKGHDRMWAYLRSHCFCAHTVYQHMFWRRERTESWKLFVVVHIVYIFLLKYPQSPSIYSWTNQKLNNLGDPTYSWNSLGFCSLYKYNGYVYDYFNIYIFLNCDCMCRGYLISEGRYNRMWN